MLLYQLCSTHSQKQGQRNHLASVFPGRQGKVGLGALKPCCFIPSEKYQAGKWVTQTRSEQPKRI